MPHDLETDADYELTLATEGPRGQALVRAKFLGYEPEAAVDRTLIFEIIDEPDRRSYFKESDIFSVRRI
jgi:hypothetical protein